LVSDFVSHSVKLISFVLAAKAQEKTAKNAAAEERACACKNKQVKTKAKAAEREHCQNQENIYRKLYLASMSPLLRPVTFSS